MHSKDQVPKNKLKFGDWLGGSDRTFNKNHQQHEVSSKASDLIFHINSRKTKFFRVTTYFYFHHLCEHN